MADHVRETFTITRQNLTDGYVSLSNVPIKETVEVEISDLNIEPLYHSEYFIQADEEGTFNLLTWRKGESQLGFGLDHILYGAEFASTEKVVFCSTTGKFCSVPSILADLYPVP